MAIGEIRLKGRQHLMMDVNSAASGPAGLPEQALGRQERARAQGSEALHKLPASDERTAAFHRHVILHPVESVALLVPQRFRRIQL